MPETTGPGGPPPATRNILEMAPKGLLELFDRTYVINLPERVDRRREIEAELRRPLLGSTRDVLERRVHFFEATWPVDPAPFASTGVKGNFISHLSILSAARADGLESVLILEDDAEFERQLASALPLLETSLRDIEWGVIQLGYMAVRADVPTAPGPALIPFAGEVRGAHCYAVHHRALAALVTHLERQLSGTPGDDVYGPMAFDGSLNTFAWANGQSARQLLVPSVCRQRSSPSSVFPRFHDRLTRARGAVRLVRRWRRALRDR